MKRYSYDLPETFRRQLAVSTVVFWSLNTTFIATATIAYRRYAECVDRQCLGPGLEIRLLSRRGDPDDIPKGTALTRVPNVAVFDRTKTRDTTP